MKDTRHLLGRRGRRVLWALGALVLLLGLALVGARVWLGSEGGQAFVREKVAAALADTLEGHVDFDRLELDGDTLRLESLKLYTPEGELVAEVKSVTAEVTLPALLRQVVNVRRVEVDTPRLYLKSDERGLNLARAVAVKPSPAAPPTKPAGPNRWKVKVGALTLSHGYFDAQGLGPPMTVEELGIDGALDLRLEDLRAEGLVKLRGQVTAPLAAPLALDVTASPSKGPTTAEATLTLGGSKVRASGEWPTQELALHELVVTPETGLAFLPGWPLKVPLYAKGTGSPARAVLQARAGSASVNAAGKWSTTPLAVESLTLAVNDADLAELFGVQRHSVVNATLKASLPDARPESLTGKAELSATWEAPGVGQLAQVVVQGRASKGVLTLDPLRVDAPGVGVTVRGRASPRSLDLSGRLEAKDAAELARVVSRFAELDLPPLGGTGALDVTVSGPTTHPAVKAVGQLSTLRVASVSAERITVDADLPDVTHPLDTDILLEAKRVAVGERVLSEVRLDFITRGRELDVDFSTKGLGDVTLHAVGLLDANRQGAALSTFEVKASDAAWVMEAPTHLAWGDAVVIDPLSLRDGAQRLSLSGQVKGQRVEAHLEAADVDLARLPRIVAPEAWGLSGTLGLIASASGKLPQPDLEARVSVRRGAAFGVTDVALDVDGSWKGKRATAKGTLSTSVGAVLADVDVSLPALLYEQDEPVAATITVRDVDTEKVSALLKQPLPVKGVLGAEVVLSGTGAAPVASVTVEAPSLAVSPQPGGERAIQFTLDRPTVVVTTREGGVLGVKASTSAFGGVAVVDLVTPFTLSGLRAKPPTVAALRETPVTVDVDVRGVDLQQLDAAHLVEDDELAGLAGLEGRLTGTAMKPRGALTLKLGRVKFPPVAGIDLALTVTAEELRTTLVARAQLADKPAATLDWQVEAPVERLANLDAIGEVPLTLRGALFPLALEQVMPRIEGEVGSRGTVSASVDVTGTLEEPTVRLAGSVQNLSFSRAALGSARFEVKSSGTEQRYSVALGGEGRDDLKVAGTTGLDVRLKTLRRGFDWKAAPVALALDARDLDLGFLSGAVPLVRVVGGRLVLAGTVKGTLGSPAWLGDVEWKKGRLGLFGLGDYRDIDLELHATNDAVDLKKLRLRAGGGAGSVQAKGTRLASGAWQLSADGSFDKFPIIVDDQLKAVATLKASVSGEATASLVNLKSIDLPRVDVELPEVKRKNLQDLSRPKDIIVIRTGNRVTRRQRQAAKEALAAEVAGSKASLAVRAFINAPRNIWVRGSDLNIELGLSEAFRVEVGESTQLFGEATVLRGDLSVIGRAFQIQKGSQVRFAGPAAEPYVNVIALHTNDKEKVKVTVTVVGRGTNVQLKTQSDPAMGESEIYTLLATGRRQLQRGTGSTMTTGDALTVVGQLATSQLRSVLAKKLPIDVLNFEMGESIEKWRVDVGTYLTDSVYLGGAVNTGANRSKGENQFAGRLEWQVTHGWSLEVTGGDAPAGSADVVWSRDF